MDNKQDGLNFPKQHIINILTDNIGTLVIEREEKVRLREEFIKKLSWRRNATMDKNQRISNSRNGSKPCPWKAKKIVDQIN